MFYVYGVAMSDCIKKAKKEVLKLKEPMTQSQSDEKVMQIASELFETSKPKCISGELSCPKRVQQFIELASKDSSIRGVKPMMKVQKVDGMGNPVLTKKTGKPTFVIVPMVMDDFDL